MPYLDFDTLLICNNDFSEKSLLETFYFFKNIGIKKFIFTYDYDCDLKPTSVAISKFRTLKPYLCSLAPRGVRIFTVFNIIMSDGSVYDPSFKRFSIGHSNRICLSLPYCDYYGWIDIDMNHLLYKNKQKPTFTSIEQTFSTNKHDIIDRFTSIKNSIFALDLNFITAIKSTEILNDLIIKSVNVLPSITCNIFEYAGIQKSFDLFQKRIGIRNYLKLCNNFYNSSREIISDATFHRRKD